MRRVLVTLAIGDHQKVHALTNQRMAEYAKQIDAAYVVIKETARDPVHFAKFDMLLAMADAGIDQVLYVDADIYIRRDVPDIFDYYTSAAFSELPHPRPAWVMRSINWIKNNLDPNWSVERYFNTGVMVIGGWELQVLANRIRNTLPRRGVYWEQDQLNVLMRDANFPMMNLAQRWNQFCSDPWITPENAAAAYFLHGTGTDDCAQKVKLLERYIREYP